MTSFKTLANNLRLAIKESRETGNSGGTFQLRGEDVTEFTPLDGVHSFAIGGAGEEYTVKRVTTRGLEAWIARNTYEIMNTGGVIGYWIHEGGVVLDITTIWAGVDHAKSRVAALDFATERGELAIWDFTAQESVYTDNVSTKA